MTVTASEWKYPTIRVNFEEEDSSVVQTLEFRRQHTHGKLEMTVLFRSGGIYIYHEVEDLDVAAILFANSIGSAFNNVISNTEKYEFTKIV
jgi:hypothetical protein